MSPLISLQKLTVTPFTPPSPSYSRLATSPRKRPLPPDPPIPFFFDTCQQLHKFSFQFSPVSVETGIRLRRRLLAPLEFPTNPSRLDWVIPNLFSHAQCIFPPFSLPQHRIPICEPCAIPRHGCQSSDPPRVPLHHTNPPQHFPPCPLTS